MLDTRPYEVNGHDRDGNPGRESGPAPEKAEPVQHAPLQDQRARAAADSAVHSAVLIGGFFGQLRAVRHHDASFKRFLDLLVATKIPQLETNKGTR
jgi:hypothetical protein